MTIQSGLQSTEVEGEIGGGSLAQGMRKTSRGVRKSLAMGRRLSVERGSAGGGSGECGNAIAHGSAGTTFVDRGKDNVIAT